MNADAPRDTFEHDHVFLGADHRQSERRMWTVIVLCGAMMIIEIGGGLTFGSLALIADGLHMSTHAGALLFAAIAYTVARRYARDPRFSFGTGKLGDLAGYTSAIALVMIAALIAYEAVDRLIHPVAIDFREALPIAALGLAVNLASVWLLGRHGHDHGQGHDHGHDHARHEGTNAAGRDNNMRAAIVHVVADAAVSVLVIVGLVLAYLFGWRWVDPVVGLAGAAVVVAWSWSLVRDSGGILLDMDPDRALTDRIRRELAFDGDRVGDLHLWRLGPGHFGVIAAVRTERRRDSTFYRARLAGLPALSHVTVDVTVVASEPLAA